MMSPPATVGSGTDRSTLRKLVAMLKRQPPLESFSKPYHRGTQTASDPPRTNLAITETSSTPGAGGIRVKKMGGVPDCGVKEYPVKARRSEGARHGAEVCRCGSAARIAQGVEVEVQAFPQFPEEAHAIGRVVRLAQIGGMRARRGVIGVLRLPEIRGDPQCVREIQQPVHLVEVLAKRLG